MYLWYGLPDSSHIMDRWKGQPAQLPWVAPSHHLCLWHGNATMNLTTFSWFWMNFSLILQRYYWYKIWNCAVQMNLLQYLISFGKHFFSLIMPSLPLDAHISVTWNNFFPGPIPWESCLFLSALIFPWHDSIKLLLTWTKQLLPPLPQAPHLDKLWPVVSIRGF